MIKIKHINCKDLTLEQEHELLMKHLGKIPINPYREIVEKMVLFINPHLRKKWVALEIRTKYNYQYQRDFRIDDYEGCE